jgi:pimeloyl-ACP methyl ester carboxylesterase
VQRDRETMGGKPLSTDGRHLSQSELSGGGPQGKLTFLLIHGAWHGAWCYAHLINALLRLGHDAYGIDLPGHGLDARLPQSFLVGDDQAMCTELSPAASIGWDQTVASVAEAVATLTDAGKDRIILVGHSAGGLVVSAVAEKIGHQLEGLIYIAAFMLPPGMAIMEAYQLPVNADAKMANLLVADPALIGAQRINPRSSDADYKSGLRHALYADVDDRTCEAALLQLVPDEPLMMDPIAISADRWGAVRRAYVVAEEDWAIRPGLQRLFIEKADEASPGNPTKVRSIPTSHSPFLSSPVRLAELLVDLSQ